MSNYKNGYCEEYYVGYEDGTEEVMDLLLPLLELVRDIENRTPHQVVKDQINALIDSADYRWLS